MSISENEQWKLQIESNREAFRRSLSKFDNLRFGSCEWVPASKHIIIDDITPFAGIGAAQALEMLVQSCNKGTVDVQQLDTLVAQMYETFSDSLARTPPEETIPPEETLLLYPGNGGKLVQRMLQNITAGFCEAEIEAKRVRDPVTGAVMGVNLPGINDRIMQAMQGRQPRHVVIVDDVLSTGITAEAMRYATEFSDAQWSIMAPIMFDPNSNAARMETASSLPGFAYVCAGKIFTGQVQPNPDLHFLSSLLPGDRKAEKLTAEFLETKVNPNQRDTFLAAIAILSQPYAYNPSY